VVLERARELEADLLVIGDSGKSKNLDFGGVARALLSRSPCPLWMQTTPPGKLERILAPVDMSDHSLQALRAAVDLAHALSAEVTALHCFAVEDYAYMAVPYGGAGSMVGVPAVAELVDGRRKHFHEQLEAFDWRGVTHEARFVEDDPARAILKAQEAHDLVVMGTHGRTGFSAALLGGVAYRVMRSIHRPVLAIRHHERSWLL
jgi:nucleotide-binding universal stress UspA family protein